MKAHSCHGLIIGLDRVASLFSSCACVGVCVHHAHCYPPVFLKLLLMAIYDSVCDLIFIFIIKRVHVLYRHQNCIFITQQYTR